MKNTIKIMLTFLILILLNVKTYSGDEAYREAMSAGLRQLETATSTDDFVAVANRFGRISSVETTKWLPSYYASYAMTVAAAIEEDLNAKDLKLDEAQQYLEKSSSVEHDDSEILTLQGFIYMIRITVDPANKGQQYGGLSAQALQKAKAINPDNPRALLLLAQLSFGTAQFFGSEITEACQLNDSALEIFEANDGDEDSFLPSWGRKQALDFKKRCSE